VTEWITKLQENEEEIPTFDELSRSRKIDLLHVWCTHFFGSIRPLEFQEKGSKNSFVEFSYGE
jgi:hypothetical protein